MAPRVEPGSEWVLRRGDHAGQVVEVEGQSFAGGIKYRIVKKGNSQGTGDSGDNPDNVHITPRGQFLALYERHHGYANGGVQPAFRQNNRARKLAKVPVEEEYAELAKGVVEAPKASVNGNGKVYINTADTDLSISVEMVTPDQAQAWLDRGGANRKINKSSVRRLVRAIQIGEWEITGETIKLDRDGRVRDGQHRLTAIIETGKGQMCIVVRGIKESAFDKIDTGKSRSAADVLAIHGHTSVTAKSATARGLIVLENIGHYDTSSRTAGPAPSNAQILAYVEAHPEISEAIHLADKLRIEGDFIGGTGLWAIALTLFWRISPEQTEVFVNSLIEGANLEAGSPILKLRNMYKGSARDWHASGENRERLLANTIKSWNAWRNDQLVQAISWHPTGRGAEKFPVPE
jgi:hypothetical protein